MEINFESALAEQLSGEINFIRIAEWSCNDLQLNVRLLNVIVISDDELREMHRKFLDDDTVTDVMTFDLSEDDQIEGEIYISADRARAHAVQYKVAFENELARLIIHGCLHLAGYDDHEQQDREKMKSLENKMVEVAQEKFL